jgi:DNA (cytosine-5)-methyltransferase 1
MSPPAPYSGRVQAATEFPLRQRMLASDSRHDAAALLPSARIGHRLRSYPALRPSSEPRTSLPRMPTASKSSGAGRQPTKRRPLAIDLFAGAGGLSLGLEQAGFDVLAAIEYDPVHAATHEFNFPNTKALCADISAPLSAENLLRAAKAGFVAHGHNPSQWDGELDLVAGGPPCQGFSSIGKRLIDDARNQLVFHFFRLVSELRPRYFVMENVPGIVKGGHANILMQLIEEFERVGYLFPEEQKYRILNAADFGVPQERYRLFLIGTRDDQAAIASAPEPTVQPVPKRSVDSKPPVRTDLPLGPTVWDAISDLPNPSRFPSLSASDEVLLSRQAMKAMGSMASPYARLMRGLDREPLDLSYPRQWNPALLTGSIRTVHTDKSIRRFKATKPGHTEPISRFYRLDPNGLCNTLRAGSGSERGAFTSPRPLHPFLARVLSNREAARLHSFPDWFRVHATKWHGFRQIGNAVAPRVGKAVGQQIVEALNRSLDSPKQALSLGQKHLLEFTMQEAAAHFGVESDTIPPPRTRGFNRQFQSSPKGNGKQRGARAAATKPLARAVAVR